LADLGGDERRERHLRRRVRRRPRSRLVWLLLPGLTATAILGLFIRSNLISHVQNVFGLAHKGPDLEALRSERVSARTAIRDETQPEATMLTGHQAPNQADADFPQTIAPRGPPFSASALSSEHNLLTRADALLKAGDVSGARLVLERALANGNSRAAFKLAETYDPSQLSRWGARGIRGDRAKAQLLYERAYAAGVPRASQPIATLSGAP